MNTLQDTCNGLSINTGCIEIVVHVATLADRLDI